MDVRKLSAIEQARTDEAFAKDDTLGSLGAAGPVDAAW